MSDEIPKIPNVDLTEMVFLYPQLTTLAEQQNATKEIMTAIEAHDMTPYYKHVCATLSTPTDALLLERLELNNKTKLGELEAKITDSGENLGETEVSDALIAKALYLAQIGEKVLISLTIRTWQLQPMR